MDGDNPSIALHMRSDLWTLPAMHERNAPANAEQAS